MRPAVLLPLLLFFASACVSQASSDQSAPHRPEGEAMTAEQFDVTAQLLRLADDDYFALADERRMDLADAFSKASLDGSAADLAATPPRLSLGAPRHMDLAKHGSAPVLVGFFETGLRGWQVNFQPNFRLFVKSRSTGELLHATPLVSMRRGIEPLLSGVGSPPEEAAASATRTSVVMIDLLDRLAGRLTLGEISVTAVAYDVRSNTVRIQIDGPDQSTVPTATKRHYVRFDLDERSRIDPEIVVPDRGSAQSGFRVRVATQLTDDDGILHTELNQPFLPCHVVLVGLDQPPVVVPASPPVQQIALPDGRRVFNALFLVELGGKDGPPVAPGAYQVYLDLGADFLGPYPLIVDR